mmetsp:Transcript_27185/g.41983  ORF Transcript_27185/g.41983 Transcript_27185/m.41983 type:complete len:273 (+) Transcript_27185:898-1716(+)
MPLRRPSPRRRPPKTESPSSSNATPSSARESRRSREPTLLTERPASRTWTVPVRDSDFPTRSGSSVPEPRTFSRASRTKTRPPTTSGRLPTPPGPQPTRTFPSSSPMPSRTTCPPPRNSARPSPVQSFFKDEVEIFKCLPGHILLPPEAGQAPTAGRRSLQRPPVITRAQAVCAAARVQINSPFAAAPSEHWTHAAAPLEHLRRTRFELPGFHTRQFLAGGPQGEPGAASLYLVESRRLLLPPLAATNPCRKPLPLIDASSRRCKTTLADTV